MEVSGGISSAKIVSTHRRAEYNIKIMAIEQFPLIEKSVHYQEL
jgi:hypothetical protein